MSCLDYGVEQVYQLLSHSAQTEHYTTLRQTREQPVGPVVMRKSESFACFLAYNNLVLR
jgi:hypothetical protein